MRPFLSRFGSVLVLLAVLLLLPLAVTSNYHFRVLSLIFIFGLAATGLNLLMGFAGQVSLGHAGFLGIGAYTVAILPVQFGFSSFGAIWAGALISGLLAFLVGRPILKLKGYYLAVATLGLGFLISQFIGNEAHWTGGPDGMNVSRLTVLGWKIRSAEAWYWITGGVLIVGVLVAQNIVNSSTGRALRAIHDSEIAAQVVGVDISRQKLKVFVLSAIYASFAGSLMALSTGHVTPDSTAGFLISIEMVTMVVLGGLGSVFGSILGAAILILLPQVLTVFHDYEHLMLGLVMMLCVILLPAGMVPTVQRWLKREAS